MPGDHNITRERHLLLLWIAEVSIGFGELRCWNDVLREVLVAANLQIFRNMDLADFRASFDDSVAENSIGHVRQRNGLFRFALLLLLLVFARTTHSGANRSQAGILQGFLEHVEVIAHSVIGLKINCF